MPPPSPPLFFNRELSWLDFNCRVLEEAADAENPLLDRVKFLAITASNLDEFFMVRVGGLQMLQERRGRATPDPSGFLPATTLAHIRTRVDDLLAAQAALWRDTLRPALHACGIHLTTPADLLPHQREALDRLFDEQFFPVLTPVALPEEEERLPAVAGLTLHLAVRLAPAAEGAPPRFAVVALGHELPRFVPLPDERQRSFLWLEDLLRLNLHKLFPGERILESAAFRVTRNADMGVREDLAADLLEEMKGILTERRQSDCVRLEMERGASRVLAQRLADVFDARSTARYAIDGPLQLGSLFALAALPGFDPLREEPWPPHPSPDLDPRQPVFTSLARGDVLLCHPYESFDPVVRLLEEAAADPDVVAIKQILYRTSRQSPVVAALMRAAESGKAVTAVVELKARFDEQRNIGWATALERAGVQVIYGVRGLKTHAKACLVVRREGGTLRRYMHFGTGNYNELTARLYTDVSLLTCDPDLGADASQFFNMITGYSEPQAFRKLSPAPLSLRDRLLAHIEGEITRRKQGQRARIVAKVNSLVDPILIQALYRASRAGVKIQLCVRGICCLRPGVEGLSENIRVVSVVDRFLEHSRVVYFHQGGEGRVFISSADWMPRNLDKRIELLIPVEDPTARARLLELLETGLADTVKGRRLRADGTYERAASSSRKRLRSQARLYERAGERVREYAERAPTVFVPHRPQRGG
jgi:polyphosphate kinase